MWIICNGADWTTIDGNGSLRTAAWADGGVNDICPVGFSVPTKEELKKDTVDTYPNIASKDNAIKAFNSFLKIPVAGYRDNNGTVQATHIIISFILLILFKHTDTLQDVCTAPSGKSVFYSTARTLRYL
jgi:hypothetical protein